ncbi:MAG TPA: hypothetical protein DD640_05410 [Clostridiales bacterium]|nr:hypothetical protein [Clostridiales bacterium]
MNSQVFDIMQNRGLVRGSVVQSRAGHDRLQVFLVLKADRGFIWLADGSGRKHGQPKKKRVSHVRPLGQLDDAAILDQIDGLGDPGQRDAALRRLLNDYLAANPKEEEL